MASEGKSNFFIFLSIKFKKTSIKKDEDSDYSHFSDFYEEDDEDFSNEEVKPDLKDGARQEVPHEENPIKEKSRKKKHLNE